MMESTGKTQRKEDASSFDGIEGLSAAEYLSRVSQQAKSMPNIFVESKSKIDDSCQRPAKRRKRSSEAMVPIDGMAASLAYFASGRATLTPAPSPRHLPQNVAEWTQVVITNFEQLRGYLEQCRNAGVGGRQSREPLPLMKDRTSWHIFCVGDTNSNATINGGNNNINQQSSQNAEEKKKTASASVPAWRVNLPENGYTPTTQLLCQMDQVMVRRVLSHLAYFVHCREHDDSDKLFQWIYALLARLEKPIHRDDSAVLFHLLKDLCLARSKVDCSHATVDEELQQLNTLIALIGVYFEQGNGVNGVMTTW
ncbi:MAG: hypothetical protein SGILL_006545 [Bacillariaceae sp.]